MAVEPSRRRAVAIAGHRGDVELVTTALADSDPSVRATALGALDRLGRLTDEIIRAALADEHGAVRRRACELAATRPDVDLSGALADADATVVEVAAFACGERSAATPEIVAALVDLAGRHRDPLVREAAVAALGAIGDPAGLGAILAATGDKPAIRRRAVIALAPFDGPEVDAALTKARADRDWQVRQAAEDLS